MNEISLVLAIVGALNWLMVGLFQYDVISAALGGVSAPATRIVDVIIGLGGLSCLSLLGRRRMRHDPDHGRGPS
ncbi:MAG: DUF378 domain-containing protein [Thermoflavifilum sp.]|nr:DUF378 domain-containing protein [Thermoflavifilum sp.]MCL6513890.1 DUF378 domain-containing protein [Alicyclobacillus sp.]